MNRTSTTSDKPAVLVTLRPTLYETLFTPETDRQLRAVADVTFNTEERNWTSRELAMRLAGFDAVVTGWGSPPFTDAVLEAAGRLRLVGHSAGSIKHMLPVGVFERDIAVTHAATAIAPSVAETNLLLTLLCLRQVHTYDRILHAGEPWQAAQAVAIPQELAGQRVGVIGASHTGRQFIKLLRALECEVWVYDPYLSDQRAGELGVIGTGLDKLLAGCQIVSVQAPVTAQTRRMLGAREFALLQDGAVFINTARSAIVEQDALLTELQSGRIFAALDVFDEEPLPVDSPFRRLENAIITPHIAGISRQARLRQGAIIAAEFERFFAGEPLHYRVTGEMLASMA